MGWPDSFLSRSARARSVSVVCQLVRAEKCMGLSYGPGLRPLFPLFLFTGLKAGASTPGLASQDLMMAGLGCCFPTLTLSGWGTLFLAAAEGTKAVVASQQ